MKDDHPRYGLAGRPKGRPEYSGMEKELVRDRLAEAAIQVGLGDGARGGGVAAVVEMAGLSRPTFYRYFASLNEALLHGLEPRFQEISRDIQFCLSIPCDGVREFLSFAHGVTRAFDCYLDWTRQNLVLARSLRERANSGLEPLIQLNQELCGQIRSSLRSRILEAGYAQPDVLSLDACLHCAGYLAYQWASEAPGDEDARKNTRRVMLRILKSVLMSPSSRAG